MKILKFNNCPNIEHNTNQIRHDGVLYKVVVGSVFCIMCKFYIGIDGLFVNCSYKQNLDILGNEL